MTPEVAHIRVKWPFAPLKYVTLKIKQGELRCRRHTVHVSLLV